MDEQLKPYLPPEALAALERAEKPRMMWGMFGLYEDHEQTKKDVVQLCQMLAEKCELVVELEGQAMENCADITAFELRINKFKQAIESWKRQEELWVESERKAGDSIKVLRRELEASRQMYRDEDNAHRKTLAEMNELKADARAAGDREGYRRGYDAGRAEGFAVGIASEREPQKLCGHPMACVVSSDEGTHYCGWCASLETVKQGGEQAIEELTYQYESLAGRSYAEGRAAGVAAERERCANVLLNEWILGGIETRYLSRPFVNVEEIRNSAAAAIRAAGGEQ